MIFGSMDFFAFSFGLPCSFWGMKMFQCINDVYHANNNE